MLAGMNDFFFRFREDDENTATDEETPDHEQPNMKKQKRVYQWRKVNPLNASVALIQKPANWFSAMTQLLKNYASKLIFIVFKSLGTV